MNIEVEMEEDGRWIAEISDMPGCMAYGATEREARDNVTALAARVIRKNAENSIVEPVTEDDEPLWEWVRLSPAETGLPFEIILSDAAPVVIAKRDFPARAELNDLYHWIALNADALAAHQAGEISALELLPRLRQLPSS